MTRFILSLYTIDFRIHIWYASDMIMTSLLLHSCYIMFLSYFVAPMKFQKQFQLEIPFYLFWIFLFVEKSVRKYQLFYHLDIRSWQLSESTVEPAVRTVKRQSPRRAR